MKEHHIYLYGDIWNDQSDYASEFGTVSLTDVVKQLNNGKDAEELIVHIHSRGGDVFEGFAIHDVLVNTGKKITTIIEGLCASIATIPALAGKIRQMLENSEFMIHNPVGGTYGTAEEMQKYAERLEAEQERIIDFYVEKTGGDKDKITALVEEETWLNADEAKELGFITEVIETIKAVAYFGNFNLKPNKSIKMEKELKETQTMLAKLLKALGMDNTETPKNLVLEAADGTKLTIDTKDNVPKVGDKVVTTAGEALKDEYVMPDGSTIKIAEKVITAIEPKKVEDTVKPVTPEEVQALKDMVATQAATIGTLQSSLDGYKTDIGAINTQLEIISKGIGSIGTPIPGTQSFKKPKGDGAPEDSVAAALARKREAKRVKEEAGKK